MYAFSFVLNDHMLAIDASFHVRLTPRWLGEFRAYTNGILLTNDRERHAGAEENSAQQQSQSTLRVTASYRTNRQEQ
jgi:hypothetical protein